MPVFESQSSLKKNQVRTENLLPKDLQQESKNLVKFLQDYYEFLNSQVEKFEFIGQLIKTQNDDSESSGQFKSNSVKLINGITDSIQPGFTLRIINEPGSFVITKVKTILNQTDFEIEDSILYKIESDFDIIRLTDGVIADVETQTPIFKVISESEESEDRIITNEQIGTITNEINQNSSVVYANLENSLTAGTEIGIDGNVYTIQLDTVKRDRELFPEQFSFFVVSSFDPEKDVIGNPGFIINKLSTIRDVDNSEQTIFNNIQSEFAKTIPSFFNINQIKTFKFSQNLYNIRGGEKSVEEFFKFFFNEPNVFVEFPYDKTLKPSSGNFDKASNKYVNSTGFLSNVDKLHDSFFFQRYSYVVKTPLELNKWQNPFERLIHPSGIKFFAQFFLEIIGRLLKTKMPRLQSVFVIKNLILLENIFKEFNQESFNSIEEEIESLVLKGLSRLIFDVRPDVTANVIKQSSLVLLLSGPLEEQLQSNDEIELFDINDDSLGTGIVRNTQLIGNRIAIFFKSLNIIENKVINKITLTDTLNTLIYEIDIDTEGEKLDFIDLFLKKNSLNLVVKELLLNFIYLIKGKLQTNTNEQNKFLSNNEIQLFNQNTIQQGINNTLPITIGTTIYKY